MQLTEDDYLAHYGVLRRSGRYPWGSGGPAKASNQGFLAYIDELKGKGMTEAEVANGMGISVAEMRAARTIARNEQLRGDQAKAQGLRDLGNSNVAIGKEMGKPESTVRALLAPGAKDKAEALLTTSNMLKDQVAKHKFVDVGSGAENLVGLTSTRLAAAVAILKEEGYQVHSLNQPQVTTGKITKFKVLTAPGTTRKDVFNNRHQIQQMTTFSEDNGRSFLLPHFPMSINPKRIAVKYGPDGGAQADGVIYVRPGVKDVSLGQARYAQVRILVGKNHYLKGMAMYKDDLPEGTDLQFNTNKEDTGNKFDVMKEVTGDADNPFGAQISRQIVDVKKDGSEKLTSAMNIITQEGGWHEWKRNLSSQMLSKQSPSLAKAQLNMAYERRLKEFDELSKLTNPSVKKKLLESFGDETTKASVHLQAAMLSARQRSHVILPIESMKPNEVYAPNYRNGERVVLIRHPHAGTFEIPELTVNNNQPEARRLLGDAKDAVGINSSVAQRLSGADFDGDSVIVIPNNAGKIKSTPALEGLKDFDPVRLYKLPEDSPHMTARQKGMEMGKISNLITDMTIQKASTSEIARAVRHSMVVIDAEKHHLDYKRSAKDNGIAALSQKYQGKATGGAATIISRAKGEARVPQRIPRPASRGGPIDKATGRRVFEETGATFVDRRTGATRLRTERSKRLAETEDARTLLSGPDNTGTPMERVYADHSNKMKELGNRARREAVNTRPLKYSPSAKRTYSKEVSSLNSKLAVVVRNRPLERQAQLIADHVVRLKRRDNPNLDSESIMKIKNQAITQARIRVGARGEKVDISDDEWKAIQAGAISAHKLDQILAKADLDVVRKHATPRVEVKMTAAKTARAQAMLDLGYTRAQVADALGVSLTTLDTTTDVKE